MRDGLEIGHPFSGQSAAVGDWESKKFLPSFPEHCFNAIHSAFLERGFIKPLKVGKNMFIEHPLKLIIMAGQLVTGGGDSGTVEPKNAHVCVNSL